MPVPPIKAKRISRLVRLLRLLALPGPQNTKSLTKTTGVSRRTLSRDLDALREGGVELEYDRRSDVYTLADASGLSPSDLSSNEAVALVALAEQVGSDQHVPFFAPAGAAPQIGSRACPQLGGDLPVAVDYE